MSVSPKCRAKDPSTCRYHGSLEFHTKDYREKYHIYIQALRENLLEKTSYAGEDKLEKAQQAFEEAEASYYAHDENYYELQFEVEQIQKHFDTYPSDDKEHELKERQKTLNNALAVRQKREKSEEPQWEKDTVAYIPLGAKMSTGEIVTAVRRRAGLASNKREVLLQNDKGEVKAHIWGANTKVYYLPLEEQQKAWSPNLVPESMKDFASKVRDVWDEDTSTAGKTWSGYRPEKGQCAVTALLVQDNYGGTLNRALVNGESHYWNTLPDGTEVDLTRAQFDAPVVIEEPIKRDREYLLSSEQTVKRYNLLKERLTTNS